MNDTQRRILIVEDEAVIAEDIEQTLRALGYGVAGNVTTGPDAVREAQQCRPDLVLMDIKLKGTMDGIECAALIAERTSIPVVYLTSHSDEATLSRAMASAPFGYVLKPFAERELKTAVEVALARHALERELREAHTALAKKTALLEGVLNNIDDAIVACDAEGNVLLANTAGKHQSLASAPLRSADAGGPNLFIEDEPCSAEELPISRSLRGETLKHAEVRVCGQRGEQERWFSVTARPFLGDNDEILGSVAVSRDVTDLKSLQLELERLCLADELTGLFNRRGLLTLGEQQLRVARRAGERLILLYADLNGMKQVNDELGHEVGDQLLVDAANVLRSAFRDSDIVARLGGDEFVVLLVNPDQSSADLIVSRLKDAVARFNDTAARRYRLSMSIGVCIADPRTQNTFTLRSMLLEADEKMYTAKERRRRYGSPSLPMMKAVTLPESGVWEHAARGSGPAPGRASGDR